MLTAPVLIRIDWIAGVTVGVAMLVASTWLAEWYALPIGLVLAIAAANLGFGGVSFTLSRRTRGRRVPGLGGMAVANMAWGAACLAFAVAFASSASWLGIASLAIEALAVGGLGVLELRAHVATEQEG